MMSAARFARRTLPLVVLLLAFWLAPRVRPAQAQAAGGAVAGRVLNGSTGNAPVAGATVQLYRFDGSNKTVVATAQSAADGSFQFGSLQTDATFQYAAAATFDSVTYASDVVKLQAGQTAQADVTVYASTDAGGTISVTRMSIVLAGADSKAGILTLVESYHLNNSANAAYIGAATGGMRRTLSFPLYIGARSLTALEGFTLDEAVATTSGFALTSPVLPGDSVVSFTYDLPYRSSSLALRRTLAYPTAQAEVILPADIRIASPQLRHPASVQLGGRSFNTVQSTDLAAGTPMELDVSGLPADSQPLVDLNSLPVQVAIVGVILALIAAGVLYERQRSGAGVRALSAERRELLRRAAELDDLAERGAVDSAAYRSERGLALLRVGEIEQELDGGKAAQAPPVAVQRSAGRRRQTDKPL